jgi:hypothetical protein
MLIGYPFSLDQKSQRYMFKRVLDVARWSLFVSNWSIALNALRQLWESGKASEFKTPFYEPVEKPVDR